MLGTVPGLGRSPGGCPRAMDPAHPFRRDMWQPQSCLTQGRALGPSKICLLCFLKVSLAGVLQDAGELCAHGKPSTKLLWTGPGQQLKCPAGFAVMESGSDSRMVLPVNGTYVSLGDPRRTLEGGWGSRGLMVRSLPWTESREAVEAIHVCPWHRTGLKY